MKLEKRSERFQSLIDGFCEMATIVFFFVATYVFVVIAWAVIGG